MVEEVDIDEQYELPVGAGESLRAARKAKGLSLTDVAAETRIAQRHLEMIEAGDFAGLPGRTYAIGFSRSYAREVGLDEAMIARLVRKELELAEPEGNHRFKRTFEPGDPARVPSARLAWFSAFAGLLLVVGGSIFLWRSYIAPTGSLPWLTSDQPPAAQMAVEAEPGERQPRAAPDPAGEVVFTALEDGIWVKFYDSDGRQLMQKQMAKGETYAVPADAQGPQLWTGRPDALAISIGGRSIPPLAEGDRIMKDVPVTAAALLERVSEEVSPTG